MKEYRRFTQEEIESAKQVNLIDYIQRCEPGNLKKVAGNEYCTAEHDSLRISNGKWHWHSKGIGGHDALSYLQKVRGMNFPEAVQALLEQTSAGYIPMQSSAEKETEKVFSPPARNYDHNRVISYLEKRGISRAVIFHCIKNKTLYESRDYHSAVFIGMDADGNPKYGNIRSTFDGEKAFKGECKGSDKRYAFQLIPKEMHSTTLHVFEASIDALSYATYAQMRGAPWKEMNLLALGGVSGSGQKVPLALDRFLKEHPQIQALYLHLDNDTPGRDAARNITELLKGRYEIRDIPPQGGKDVNDFLQRYQNWQKTAVKQREMPSI